mgnify:FL=1
MFPSNFRETPFTHEELARFRTALSAGRVSDLISLLSDVTPEKEIEVQKLINHFSPVFKGYEQKVKGFLEQLQSKDSLAITEPQQEQKVQELIDKELNFVKTKNKLEAAVNELSSLKANSIEETSKIQTTIKEHKTMLKNLETSLADEITLENLKSILKNVTISQERVLTPPASTALPADPKKLVEEPKEESMAADAKSVLPAEDQPLESSLVELDETLKTVPKELSEAPAKEEVKEPEPKLEEEEVAEKTPEEPKEEKVGGKTPKECCGSKGLRHKKNCSTKQ